LAQIKTTMSRVKAAVLIALLMPGAWAISGCTKNYCDTADTAVEDTADSTYEGARKRAPENGWRIYIEP
jgi:hypothetical protein